MHHFLVGFALVGCSVADSLDRVEQAGKLPGIVDITIRSDGTFDRPVVHIASGDTVRWHLFDPSNAIVPVSRPPIMVPGPIARAAALVPLPYHFDPNSFVGPMPVAPGGVFALNPAPWGFGLVESTEPCGELAERANAGGLRLCASEPSGAVMDATWSDPSITGVYLRLAWNMVNPGDGVYDWTGLDHEIDQAVAHGKLYSIAVEAGERGTPNWIFSTSIDGYPRAGLVPRLGFQDQSSNPDEPARCGPELSLGSPTDEHYRTYYFAMLTELANHLKQRADRYRALAYIKPSGANLFTAENRLPKTCDPLATDAAGQPCICNTQVWADAGYTASGLEDFYAAQLTLLESAFVTKVMSYQLIQDGFPLVNDSHGYVTNTEVRPHPWTSGAHLAGDAQTQANIDDGVGNHHARFAVQHNGLQPLPDPAAGSCPSADGCPNPWVLDSGALYTGFQTQNTSQISTSALLDSALVNGKRNSAASFIEVYEERVWEARTIGGPLDAITGSSRTLADWDAYFRARREPITPMTYEHVFYRTVAMGSQELVYAEASKLGTGNFGTIIIDP